MATLTIKSMPDKLYQALKQNAQQHRRSINSEALVCLERSLAQPIQDPEKVLEDIRVLRQNTARYMVTAKEIQVAKNKGRK